MIEEEPGLGVVFTSANAVTAVEQPRAAMRAWCVGQRTAEAARSAGFAANVVGQDADSMVAAILGAGETGPLVHFRGRESRGNVATRLSEAGVPCREVIVYEQYALPLGPEAAALLGGEDPALVPLFSPNSARRLAAELHGRPLRAPLHVVALSPAVASAWDADLSPVAAVATRPDQEALCAALQSVADSP